MYLYKKSILVEIACLLRMFKIFFLFIHTYSFGKLHYTAKKAVNKNICAKHKEYLTKIYNYDIRAQKMLLSLN